MNKPIHSSNVQSEDSCLQDLIKAHADLIRIHQQLLNRIEGVDEDQAMKSVHKKIHSLPGVGMQDLAPIAHVGVSEQVDPSESNTTLGGVIAAGAGVLLVAIAWILYDRAANNRGAEANHLARTQMELAQSHADLTAARSNIDTLNQTLKQTEKALIDAQEVIRGPQERNASIAAAVPPPVEAKPLSKEEQFAHAQQELRNVRTALAANQQDLLKNMWEYRATAKTLAQNRQSIFKINLKIRHANGEFSNDELALSDKPWEEFLPMNARFLLNDPRLDGETSATSAAVPIIKDAHGSKDDVPATLPEVQALLVKNVAELTTVMKQVTNIQADIIQTQSDLTISIDELTKKSKELLILRNARTGLN